MISFQNLSFWEKETFLHRADVLILGSGIVGLSTAIFLKERDPSQKVTVLERGYLPCGASTKNAGFSCIGSPSELLDDLGKNSASDVFATVEKRWKGLQNLNSMLGTDNIGYLELGSHELFRPNEQKILDNCLNKINYLNQELEGITGIQGVFQLAPNIPTKFGFEGFSSAISHKAEGQINTGKMMRSLIKKAQQLDILILTGIEVTEIDEHTVYTQHGKLSFNKLAVCTNGFSKRFFPELDVEPARAQVVVTSPIENLKFQGIFHLDAGYYYFRNIGDRVLLGGGRNLDFEGENTTELENTKLITNQLKQMLSDNILPNTSFEIEHQWAGTMGVGKAKSPIVDQVSENIFCGIRLGGMGVAIGSLVGKELAEKIHS